MFKMHVEANLKIGRSCITWITTVSQWEPECVLLNGLNTCTCFIENLKWVNEFVFKMYIST